MIHDFQAYLMEKKGNQIIEEDELTAGRPAAKPQTGGGPAIHRLAAKADDPRCFLNLDCLSGEKISPEGFWAGKVEILWRIGPSEKLGWHDGTPSTPIKNIS